MNKNFIIFVWPFMVASHLITTYSFIFINLHGSITWTEPVKPILWLETAVSQIIVFPMVYMTMKWIREIREAGVK